MKIPPKYVNYWKLFHYHLITNSWQMISKLSIARLTLQSDKSDFSICNSKNSNIIYYKPFLDFRV